MRRTLWVSVAEGVFTSVFLAWTAGAVLTGYMLHLGATPMDLALVASVPLLAQIVAPVAAWIEGIARRRMAIVVVTALIGRGVWVLAPVVPFFTLSPTLRSPQILVLLVAFSSVFQASAGAVWTAWMGDVVPQARRGRYFGLRAGIVGIVVLIANLAAGRFLDTFDAPLSFQIIISVGLVFAAIGIYLYSFQHDPPSPWPPPPGRTASPTWPS